MQLIDFTKNCPIFQLFIDFTKFLSASAGNGGLAMLGDGKVFCTQCSKTFSTLQSGKQHYNEVHQPTASAICKICGRVFKNKRSRDNHYSQKHQVSATAMKNTFVPPPPKMKRETETGGGGHFLG